MEEHSRTNKWWIFLLLLSLLIVGGVIGHFAFPRVVINNNQYGIFNYSNLRISVDERTGNCSIFGLRPGNLWVADVDGISMWPTWRDGSTVIMEEVQPQDEIRLWDIVAFDHDGKFVTHRVVAIGEDQDGWYALTEGDNKDEPVLSYKCRRSEIWGKVRIYIDY